MRLLYYKYRSYAKGGIESKEEGERDPGEPNKSQRKFNYIGIVEKKKPSKLRSL